MPESDHPAGIETRSVSSGWVATLHHGDGTATAYWGPTEDAAVKEAQNGGED